MHLSLVDDTISLFMNCQYHGQYCGGRLGDAKASLGRPLRFQSVPGRPSRPSPVVDNYRPGSSTWILWGLTIIRRQVWARSL
eukprot:8817766-Heterocapsa_arctica.AAC.1